MKGRPEGRWRDGQECLDIIRIIPTTHLRAYLHDPRLKHLDMYILMQSYLQLEVACCHVSHGVSDHLLQPELREILVVIRLSLLNMR